MQDMLYFSDAVEMYAVRLNVAVFASRLLSLMPQTIPCYTPQHAVIILIRG